MTFQYNKENDTVTISREKYNNLLESAEELDVLHDVGHISKHGWYSECLREYAEQNGFDCFEDYVESCIVLPG